MSKYNTIQEVRKVVRSIISYIVTFWMNLYLGKNLNISLPDDAAGGQVKSLLDTGKGFYLLG